MTSRKAALPSLLVSMLVCAAAPAAAELRHRQTLDGIRGVSLAYDAQLCGTWVATEGPTLSLYSPGGREILSIDSGFSSVRSLTVEEDGLLLADGWGRFRRIDRTGRPRDETFSLSDRIRDTEGLHRDADGSFLVVEDDPSRLLRLSPDGAVLMELWGDGFDPPMVEPQGVERDPYSGNILVVDDNEGRNALFELSPDGAVLSVTPLSEWGRDAEGVALQPETGTLFIGFDGGVRLSIFDWRPSGMSIDTPLDHGPACAYS
ncbi:hypothetical protein ROJ8625_03503 [Roseivivax jejudonensis]|uniref:Phytase-like domain-containing protein n=1 Tax=Roseivivax jejudonensis TaxID=1529041 RepID=A0A1X7A248_9RHOB|nr:hypothetical protein [Roseivivax jejudonensis]SLN67956.1 hypothetical protein ROJ8625_03503 [Roseivivax jejudonensis]